MTIDTKKIYSTISQFQGEMTQAHFELVSTYLYEGQNSKLRDLDCNLILTYLISKSLDYSAISALPYLSLSSTYNGPIAVRLDTDTEYENRPETGYYSADFKIMSKTNIEFELPGYVYIDGYRYSPFIKFFKNTFSLLIRESGF